MVRFLPCPGPRLRARFVSLSGQSSCYLVSTESVARQSEYGIRSSDLDDGAPVKVGTDSDEAEDDLRSVPPSSGESELSTVIVNPDLGKIWRYLRGPDPGLGTKVFESDWYSPKGSESLEFECDRDSTWETVSASDLVSESRAGGSDSSTRISMSFNTIPSRC